MKDLAPQRTNGGVFDVVAYGADPTGSANSQPAFQAAADALVAYNSVTKPGTLLIPGGSYKLNSAVVISGGSATVMAYGAYIFSGAAGNDLLRDYTTQDGSYTLNGQGLQVLGGTWDLKGHTWAQSVEGASAFTISNSTNLLFRDVTVRNVRAYHGIDMNTCDGVTVESCRFEGFKNSHEWKTDVVAASVGALTLSAPQTVDGVAVIAGDRVLVKDQASGAANGIYVVAAGSWTRATDMPAASTTAALDAAVKVTGGTVNAGMNYYQTANPATVNTTALVWTTYWKKQVRVATTVAGTLATSFANGQTVDGVVLATNDRILLKNQAAGAENGIYVVTAGTPTRPADMDVAAEANGASVAVTAGTANAGTNWKQTATIVTIGTTAQVWSTEYRVNRYFSEAVQVDEGPNGVPSKNVTVKGCYMGPALDGSGLLSFGKLAGSHTDSASTLFSGIHIVDNTSIDSLSNAIQGYSWADSIVKGNIINGSSERGIRFFFGSSNNGPRLNITENIITNTLMHGIEIDGGGPNGDATFGDVTISGNTIALASLTAGYSGIRVDTMNRSNISNNQISLLGSSGGDQGIYAFNCQDVNLVGNNITNVPVHGIQISASKRVSCTANRIYSVGSNGIYLTSGSVTVGGSPSTVTSDQCVLSSNLIMGAGRTVTSGTACIRVSNAANTANVIINNRMQKFGSGNEVATPVIVDGGSPSGTEVIGNSYGRDWNSAAGLNFSNYNFNGDGDYMLYEPQLTRATATTLTTTSATDVTGLTMALPTGTFKYEIMLNITNSTATGMSATLVGPTIGNSTCMITRATTTTAATECKTGSFPYTSAITSPAVPTTIMINGTMTVSAAGTFKVQVTRTGGTTGVVTTGSYMKVESLSMV